jgi:hypothetical protein
MKLLSGSILKSYFTIVTIFAFLLLSTSTIFADYGCENNFVRIEIAQAYIVQNPYIIAISEVDKNIHLFKAVKIFMDDERITISGPIILSWNVNSSGQRTFFLPDSGKIFTDELCGNYQFGYYKPMRTAFALGNLFGTSGGGVYDNHLSFIAFPEPEIIPDVEKGYSSWLEQLPNVVQEYCLWWYANASTGPPVLYEIIDSVISVSEGDINPHPMFTLIKITVQVKDVN